MNLTSTQGTGAPAGAPPTTAQAVGDGFIQPVLSIVTAIGCAILLLPWPRDVNPSVVLYQWGLRHAPTADRGTWANAILVALVVAALAMGVARRASWAVVLGCALAALYAVRANSEPAAIAVSAWLAFIAAAALNLPGRRTVLTIVRVILAVHVAVALVLFLLRYQQFFTPGFGLRAGSVFKTPNNVYPLAAAGVCLFAADLGEACRSRALRLLSALLLAGALALLVFTYSRGGWIGAGVGLAFLAVRMPRGRLLAGLLGGMLIGSACLVRLPDGGAIRLDPSAEGRLTIWGKALQLAADEPIFGHGSGGYMRSVLGDRPLIEMQNGPLEPKSGLINVAIELGLLGLVFWALFLWTVLRRSNSKDVETQRLSYPCAAALVAIVVASFVDTPVLGDLGRLHVSVLFLVLAGLLAGLTPSPPGPLRDPV